MTTSMTFPHTKEEKQKETKPKSRLSLFDIKMRSKHEFGNRRSPQQAKKESEDLTEKNL